MSADVSVRRWTSSNNGLAASLPRCLAASRPEGIRRSGGATARVRYIGLAIYLHLHCHYSHNRCFTPSRRNYDNADCRILYFTCDSKVKESQGRPILNAYISSPILHFTQAAAANTNNSEVLNVLLWTTATYLYLLDNG